LLAPHAQRRPSLAGELPALAARFQLHPAEQRLAHGLDGTRTLAAVRELAPIDPVHAAQVLAALVLGGALRWDEPASRPAARGAADANAVTRPSLPGTRAPAARAPEPAPPHDAAPPAPPPARPVADDDATRPRLRLRLGQVGKSAIDPKSAGLEAERAFRQGLALLRQSALPGALRAFGRACALRGDEPEYRMYEAWTELQVARDDAARAVARAKTEACAQRVLARDADALRAHTILGQLAIASGNLEGAEQHFRVALRKAPQDRDALRGMRLVERRRGAR
jgi:hypothetical protein